MVQEMPQGSSSSFCQESSLGKKKKKKSAPTPKIPGDCRREFQKEIRAKNLKRIPGIGWLKMALLGKGESPKFPEFWHRREFSFY